MTNQPAAATHEQGNKGPAATQDEQLTSSTAVEPEVKDADRPAAKPQGSLSDQVATMESEGQAQPQSDEAPAESSSTGIPPLPEPNVEGVGNESGPSAFKTGLKGESLTPAQAKQAKDASGF